MSPMTVKRDGDEIEVEGNLEGFDIVGCVILVIAVIFTAGVVASQWLRP